MCGPSNFLQYPGSGRCVLERYKQMFRMAVGCEACFEDKRLGLERAFVDVPQPRYIGPNYWDSSVRVVILLINPGAGNGDLRDQVFRDRLRRYRSGDACKLEEILHEDQPPDWRRFRPFYFRDLGLRADEIAVANVAWCSTNGNKYPKEMLDRCFRGHTSDLLQLLSPDVILLSGSPIHRFKTKLEAIVPKTRVILTPHYANREGVAYAEKEAQRIRAELGSASGYVFRSVGITPEDLLKRLAPKPNAAPKTPKARTAPKVHTDDSKIVRMLVTSNPKKGASRYRFALYMDGKTVSENLKAGLWRGDIAWDLKHNFIKLEEPAPAEQPSTTEETKQQPTQAAVLARAASKCESAPPDRLPRKFNASAKIAVLKDQYPFRGKRFAIWSKLESGLTVAEFSARVKALGAHGNGIGDLQIYLEKGLITVEEDEARTRR